MGGTLGDPTTPSSTTTTCGGEVATIGRDGRTEGGHRDSWVVEEVTEVMATTTIDEEAAWGDLVMKNRGEKRWRGETWGRQRGLRYRSLGGSSRDLMPIPLRYGVDCEGQNSK
jgi:hypothetical protein